MSGFDYDLFVIGAGSGGVRAGRIAARYGARVAVAEEYRVGGTCVIRGCVPKKLFVYASKFAEEFEDAVGFGWTSSKVSFDWWTLVENKNREIDRLNKAYIRNLEAAGAELILERATVEDANTVRLAGGRKVTARYILVATGATPFVPRHLPGHELAITSNEAFNLERLPSRIVIVGGGYIAVEFAGIFSGLGVETVLVYRGEQILRGFDDDLRNHLAAEMKKKGIELRTRADVASIERSGDGVRVTFNDGAAFGAGQIMFATGRIPNVMDLGLDKAGVELTPHYAVKVDDYSQTTVPSIYAVGDVTNRANLTPVAIREGHAFADTVFGGKPVKVDHSLIPTAVFSQPELGTVGLTEAQAREQVRAVDIYKTSFRPMKHTLSGRDERILMKLVVDGETDRVLGCHICGPDAGEMAQLLGISLRLGAKKSDFDATMAVHPTAAEELVTMREKWTG
ncbi:glutathione-disulfide reductase [Aestuariivirga litoralis]|uniref:Glutathione reductase n=1 Tax=Aestuariivirga litoralis TaxID=2650924 RepID=A0A2W2BN83_9HYPH|nr:glutathione-disulfide reductase [Aestuariivirga litoralis]PZF77709.1 glutathione-disulfide reductase [Aestuariivirga litoralis]